MENTPGSAPARKASRTERAIIVLSVLSFTLVMVVFYFDTAKAVGMSLWVLFSLLGLIALVVYGLLLVMHAADPRLGVRFNFTTMVCIVLASASLTFFGQARLGDISQIAPIVALAATLLFTFALRRSLHRR